MRMVAVLAAAVAGALLLAPPPASACGRRNARRPVGTLPVVALGGATAASLVATARGTTLALGMIVLATAVGAFRLGVLQRAAAAADRRADRVVEACESLVGELRAGHPPEVALQRAVEVWPELEPVAVASRLGSDVPTALRRLAVLPGARGAAEIAGAWQVSSGSGAGLALTLAQVTGSARQRQATQRLVASELASARATARLVAVLPLFVLLLGSGAGGDPWHFLLHTPAGLGCLGGGLALGLVGLAWIERVATKAVAA
jgi:tight adherence protein B